jgi:N-methylhydantoinase A/oxoprolinase/acetone carboxylase beta subunit
VTIALGVDVGGTFTDAVVIAPDGITTEKVLTTVRQEDGVVEASRRALARAGLRADDVDHVVHGSTVATNALLARRLADPWLPRSAAAAAPDAPAFVSPGRPAGAGGRVS